MLKQNYFIGIKTPWTLENEEVWKLTHLYAGKMWVIGGLLVVVLSLIVPEEINFYFFTFYFTSVFIILLIEYQMFRDLLPRRLPDHRQFQHTYHFAIQPCEY